MAKAMKKTTTPTASMKKTTTPMAMKRIATPLQGKGGGKGTRRTKA